MKTGKKKKPSMKISEVIVTELMKNPEIESFFLTIGQAAINFQTMLEKARPQIEAMGAMLEKAQPQIKMVMESMGELFINVLVSYEEMAKRYPKLQDKVIPMAKRGWFISGYFGNSELMELANLCDTLTEDDLDHHIADMYRSSLTEHTADLLKDYKDRGFAIQPAVDAHLRGEYALSIPVFFAQSDGILHHNTHEKLHVFSGSEKTHNCAKEIVQGIKDLRLSPNQYTRYDWMSLYMEMMCMQLSEKDWPLAYGKKDRETHPYFGLNRHTVMHGISLDYATEGNSLKAFSLLSYIGSLKDDLIKIKPEDAFSYLVTKKTVVSDIPS